MRKRKTRPKVFPYPAITITRTAYEVLELAYIAIANKPIRYDHGSSRIAYIGTTKNGVRRVANSAAWKAEELFSRNGVHTLEFYFIATPRRGKQPTYRNFERALLLRFRERYGSPPVANMHGKKIRRRDGDDYFTSASIEKILNDFAL